MKTYLIMTLLMIASVANAKDHIIVQKDKSFSVTKIKVKLGDKLMFKNDEKSIIHNVYSLTPGNGFDLETQKPGETDTLVINAPKHKAGKMMIECAIHPQMQLEVEVVK